MYVQYVGFNPAASSRSYAFHVIDEPAEAHDFTVNVLSWTFLNSPPLKFQDGPGLCFERVTQALQRETKESRAETHLRIRDQDVKGYLKRHYPQKSAHQAAITLKWGDK